MYMLVYAPRARSQGVAVRACYAPCAVAAAVFKLEMIAETPKEKVKLPRPVQGHGQLAAL